MKDRVALSIIQDAFANGTLQDGGLITEGTAGSTGIQCSSMDDSLVLKGLTHTQGTAGSITCNHEPGTRLVLEVWCTDCWS